MQRLLIAVLTLILGSGAVACATLGANSGPAEMSDLRRAVIARAQVWNRTPIRAMDLKAGPALKGAFPFRATVTCDYMDKNLDGRSPKFACLIDKADEVKVKFGGNNGEVYGEVLATRLLWALGFGADGMYPVNVICRGCPDELLGIVRPGGESRFDPAVIERKMPAAEWPSENNSAWSWRELDEVDPEFGASRAQRDALKLLAVFVQHTDSKPQQQRIVCASGPVPKGGACRRPFLMINDLGLTFGRANRSNANGESGVNLDAWRQTRVWRDEPGCRGNLPKSFTGTLDDPQISEAGRQFLAGLLVQLSDRQLRDLFEAARVQLRLRSPGDVDSGYATVDEWVTAFKDKRAEIVNRRCA